MSANHSLVLFEGDVRADLSAIFECFDLSIAGEPETAQGLAEIWEYTNWPRKGRPRHVVHKAILYNGLWTAVLDREMTMILDEEKCETCAKKFGIKIFGYMIESVSGTCALYLYCPYKIRGLNIQNFEVLEDFGNPLPQESGLQPEDMLEDGAMRVSRRLGFSDSLFAHPTSKVQVVGLEDPVRSAVLERMQSSTNHKAPRRPQPVPQPVNRLEKPWWKLW